MTESRYSSGRVLYQAWKAAQCCPCCGLMLDLVWLDLVWLPGVTASISPEQPQCQVCRYCPKVAA